MEEGGWGREGGGGRVGEEGGGGGEMYRGILLRQLKINWTMDSSHAAEWHRHVLYIGNEWHIQSQGNGHWKEVHTQRQ